MRAYPAPAAAARLGEGRRAAFLRRHRYTGRSSAAPLVERLRSAPAGLRSGPEAEARAAGALALVRILTAPNESVADLERRIAERLRAHPDGHVFASLPRAGTVDAAQMLAEWGDGKEAFAGPDAVAALAGLTPVTRRSGKHRTVGFRWARNERFRCAVTTFADDSRRASPWAAGVYRRARERGCDHAHAVRVLARAWVGVVYRCWPAGEACDVARHGAARGSAPLAARSEQPRPHGPRAPGTARRS